MAMRPRGGAQIPRPQFVVRPKYEDFEPTLDQKEDPTSYVLHVYLPGFTREQLKVTYVESAKKIKARGERPLGNYKWSRFEKEFIIPNDCIGSQVRGKFESNVLTITMQKKATTQVPPQESPTSPAEPKKTEEAIPPKEDKPAGIPSPDKSNTESKPQKADKETVEPMSPPEVITTQAKTQKVQDQSPTKQGDESVAQKAMEVERDSSNKNKEVGESAMEKKMEKSGDQERPEMSSARKSNRVRDVSGYGKEVMGKIAKRLKEDEDCKSLVINAGVAAMVIVAMGTYIAYTIASGDANN